jgi:hypothetical protein
MKCIEREVVGRALNWTVGYKYPGNKPLVGHTFVLCAL